MKKLKLTVLLSFIMVVSVTMVTCNNIDWSHYSEVEVQIIKDYYHGLDNPHGKIKLKDVYILKNYGTYGESVVIVMALYCSNPPPKIEEIAIEGFLFGFNTGLHIKVWNNGNFYSLQGAYDEGFISIEELGQIHSLHTEKWYLGE